MNFLLSLAPYMYIIFIAVVIFSLYAQIKISTTFRKYSKAPTRRGATASEVASMILRTNGVYDVSLGRVRGNLTDHFDPRSNTLALSDTVYASSSAAAVGVAAHEAGHAIQHNVGYFPIKLRGALVPITNFASSLSWIFIAVGFLLVGLSDIGDMGFFIALLGVMLFSFTTLFQLVTLPCEFNASSRAIASLRSSGWYTDDELRAARRVLSAAALTYVAATLTSVVQLLRLLIILLGRRNNR